MADLSEKARNWIGTPFHHRAAAKNVGCDCFGLLVGVLRELGHKPDLPWPNYHSTQHTAPHDGLGVVTLDPFLTRDEVLVCDRIILFELKAKYWHLGITISATQFVHAHQLHGVIVGNLDAAWRQRLRRIYKI